MALLSIEDEMERAEGGAPFSNSTDGFGWMAIWCEECTREPDCPLLVVALMNRTPAAWTVRDPAAINKYTCTEFEKSTADDPTVVIEGGETTPV